MPFRNDPHKPTRMITHRIANADFPTVGEHCHKLVRRLSGETDEDVIVAASALLFVLLAERFEQNPRRLLEYAQNMVTREADRHPMLIGGLRDYLKYELGTK